MTRRSIRTGLACFLVSLFVFLFLYARSGGAEVNATDPPRATAFASTANAAPGRDFTEQHVVEFDALTAIGLGTTSASTIAPAAGATSEQQVIEGYVSGPPLVSRVATPQPRETSCTMVSPPCQMP